MTRFYFDYRDDDDLTQDDIGFEFQDLAAVKTEASRALAEYALEVVPGTEQRILSIEVRDDEGLVLATRIEFEVVRLRAGP